MSANPKMTVAQLREALNNIETKYGNCVVSIWLPGSLIDLAGLMSSRPNLKEGEILIEGNLREGSALS
jgi:hypothetical protein